ncbi:MAG: hypothetical protein ACR2MK_05105 [Solirubrobacteraceae bacterium]
MSASAPLFRFVQVELPWRLGPPDGRYLLRPASEPEASPAHVIVLSTLGAPERRRLASVRRPRDATPEPEPTPVSTGRATVIDVGHPLDAEAQAREWLRRAGEDELERGLEVLNRALHAFRLVTADPYLHTVSRRQAIVARLGFGAGEQVADGLWSDARELVVADGWQRRSRVLHPQARLAAVLGAREQPLACEELALRARLDLDQGRDREAALQVLVTLDAALAELARDPTAEALSDRLAELRGQRTAIALAAQSALAGPLPQAELESVFLTLGRIEAALRARAVQNA